MVASWSLTEEMAGSSPFTVVTNIFVTKFTEFSETFRKNSVDLLLGAQDALNSDKTMETVAINCRRTL